MEQNAMINMSKAALKPERVKIELSPPSTTAVSLL